MAANWRVYTEVTAYVVLAVGAAVGLYMYAQSDDTEDRPPIIVRDGSAIFEGGDSENPGKGQKDWKSVGNATDNVWKPVQDNGHNVSGFTVYVAGFDVKNCPQSTLAGNDVQIEYTPGGIVAQTPKVFTIQHSPVGGGNNKNEPELDAPVKLAPGSSASGFPQLTYSDAPGGWISKVSVTTKKGSLPCGFLQPADSDARNAVRITINAER